MIVGIRMTIEQLKVLAEKTPEVTIKELIKTMKGDSK